MPEYPEGPSHVEQPADRSRDEGALTGTRWGQGIDAAHPESATDQPLEAASGEDEAEWKSTARGADADERRARTRPGDEDPDRDPFSGPDAADDQTLLV